MLVKTSELSGVTLDWSVAKCEGLTPNMQKNTYGFGHAIVHNCQLDTFLFIPSTNWEQGGPIIEREKVALHNQEGRGKVGENAWSATITPQGSYDYYEYGETPLIAAMRCYVASKLGDNVEVPNELINN